MFPLVKQKLMIPVAAAAFLALQVGGVAHASPVAAVPQAASTPTGGSGTTYTSTTSPGTGTNQFDISSPVTDQAATIGAGGSDVLGVVAVGTGLAIAMRLMRKPRRAL